MSLDKRGGNVEALSRKMSNVEEEVGVKEAFNNAVRDLGANILKSKV